MRYRESIGISESRALLHGGYNQRKWEVAVGLLLPVPQRFRREKRDSVGFRRVVSFSSQQHRRNDGITPMFVACEIFFISVPPRHLLVINARDVTKMAAVTHSVTAFPLVLNDIRSVAAFTPFFMVWL